MTRKANRFFLTAGATGVATLCLAAAANGFIYWLGYDNSEFQALGQAMMGPVGFLSFISLGWFWFMPLYGTKMYLRDQVDYRGFPATWSPLQRLLFLITDDPRVIAKERQGK